jgi:hypothetical protein
MLTALPKTRQNEGESKRVWYFSSSLDMFVWFDQDDVPYAFDLTYKTRRYQERTVSWHRERGYRHWKPEVGRQRFGAGGMLVQAGAFEHGSAAAQFLAQCADLPAAISREVLIRLAAFELPAELPPAHPRHARRHSDAGLAASPD